MRLTCFICAKSLPRQMYNDFRHCYETVVHPLSRVLCIPGLFLTSIGVVRRRISLEAVSETSSSLFPTQVIAAVQELSCFRQDIIREAVNCGYTSQG